MALLQILLKVFLMPGDMVLRQAGVTVEEDGGILRSFVNMCVWGLLTVLIAVALV